MEYVKYGIITACGEQPAHNGDMIFVCLHTYTLLFPPKRFLLKAEEMMGAGVVLG